LAGPAHLVRKKMVFWRLVWRKCLCNRGL